VPRGGRLVHHRVTAEADESRGGDAKIHQRVTAAGHLYPHQASPHGWADQGNHHRGGVAADRGSCADRL